MRRFRLFVRLLLLSVLSFSLMGDFSRSRASWCETVVAANVNMLQINATVLLAVLLQPFCKSRSIYHWSGQRREDQVGREKSGDRWEGRENYVKGWLKNLAPFAEQVELVEAFVS